MAETKELKRKMAQFAGFKEADIKKHYYWAIGGQRCAKWQEPNTGYHVRLPNFPNDETACFKWLVPKLRMGHDDLKISLTWVSNNVVCYIYKWGKKTSRKKNFEWLVLSSFEAETPALALCLAIEKLIDKEIK